MVISMFFVKLFVLICFTWGSCFVFDELCKEGKKRRKMKAVESLGYAASTLVVAALCRDGSAFFEGIWVFSIILVLAVIAASVAVLLDWHTPAKNGKKPKDKPSSQEDHKDSEFPDGEYRGSDLLLVLDELKRDLERRTNQRRMATLCSMLRNMLHGIRQTLGYDGAKDAPSRMSTIENVYLPYFVETMQEYLNSQKYYTEAQREQVFFEARSFVDSVQQQFDEIIEIDANGISANFAGLAAASGGGGLVMPEVVDTVNAGEVESVAVEGVVRRHNASVTRVRKEQQ